MVNHLLDGGAQAKLEVGAADDRYEREADAVAEKVVRSLAVTGDEPAEDGPVVRRIQRRSVVGAEGGAVAAEAEGELRAAQPGGQRMEEPVRRQMERAFGTDLGHVRLHEGPASDRLNEQFGATAFTIGSDIFFRDRIPEASTEPGQRLLAHELTHTVQQGRGGRVQRKVEKIKGQKVDVADDDERKEAEKIIKELKSLYGIDIDSKKGVEAIQEDYDDVPDDVRNSLQTSTWRMMDLRAVSEAAKHYGQITGSARKKSTRKGEDQEVQVLGKVQQAIDTNTSAGKLDTSTLGEYFSETKTMNLFATHHGKTGTFGEEKKELVATFVHEMAHGLLAYAYDDFVKASGGYWTDQDTKSGADGAEAPITKYGKTNAREDLCEAAAYYFIEPETLRDGRGAAKGEAGNAAPLRFAFFEKLKNDWLPPPPAKKATKQKKSWHFWK